MKPKLNYTSNGTKGHPKDNCQTPPYAVAPLIQHLNPKWTIWEPAAGKMGLAFELMNHVFQVLHTDIQRGKDFLELNAPPHGFSFEAIITNPPFSLKYKFLARCYEIGKPFALLMPIDTLGAQTAQRLFDQHGVQVIIMDKRIDFIMPNKGEGGSAQFNSAWFTHGLNLPAQLNFVSIAAEKAAYVKSLQYAMQHPLGEVEQA